jgi:FlaA1/EpsC-like NDP-sugar epimerase
VTRQLREVRVEDMLGREPVRMELERVGAYLEGEVVLVTGAGGSIGAELCRQISRVGAKRLVLVENAENSLFEIRHELEHDRHFSRALAVLADCKDAVRMGEVFHEHQPDVVFHAAAYKHVPLMEENPVEAVRNNAVATRIVAAAAGNAGAKRFVLVSTDKAVTPTTVMGASKALAEWALEAAHRRFPQTVFTTVRFGNVLGSAGSVVPIFRRQIAAGGPVTVTDAAMTRYFMTIPEAVQLIIRSGALGTGGDVYVLEMGDPVRIVDLARNMIRLAGLEPDLDVAIETIGRRPGEKIHEELFNPDERPRETPAEKIMAAVRPPLDPQWVEEAFARVEELVYAGDARGLASTVTALAEERAVSAAPVGGAAMTPAPERAL